MVLIHEEKILIKKLSIIYSRMKYNDKKKGFLEIIPKKDFINFSLNEGGYIELYENWINNNKNHKFAPLISKINNGKGYIKDNIKFIAVGISEEEKKKGKRKRNSNYRKNHHLELVKKSKVKYQKNKENILKKQRENYIKNNNLLKEKRGDFLEKLKNMYRGMIGRSKKIGFSEIISKEDFLEFGKNNENYKKIYNDWISFNKDKRLTPSVDRINPSWPYIEGNIQFLTLAQNASKGSRDYSHNVIIKVNKEGEPELFFETLIDFAKFLGCKIIRRYQINNGSIFKKYQYKVKFLTKKENDFKNRLKEIYLNMHNQTKKYSFNEIISKKEFLKFGIASKQYKKLYDNWVNNEKNGKLTPVISRINWRGAYVLNNIEFSTISNNRFNSKMGLPIKVTKGDEALYFKSNREFSRFLGQKLFAIKRYVNKDKLWKGYRIEYV